MNAEDVERILRLGVAHEDSGGANQDGDSL